MIDSAYRKFHQLQDLPLLLTKKYKDFSYKDRYYDMHRRLLRTACLTIEETNITLTADCWLAFDQTETKYIRGWKVQQTHSSHNLAKLLLVYTVWRLFESHRLDVRNTRVRIRLPEASSQEELLLHDGTR